MTDTAHIERAERLAQAWLENPNRAGAEEAALVILDAIDIYLAKRIGTRKLAGLHNRRADEWAVRRRP